MKQFSVNLLILLILVQTFSCSSDSDCGPNGASCFAPGTSGSDSEYSSSSQLSSASIAICSGEEYSTATKYCSNGELRDYGSVQDGDGNIYKTVVIGDQTWMAENLNYNASGSKCHGDASGGDSQGKCAKYGRLYDWATAMGICPSGWHIPSDAEWNQLYHYADGTANVSKNYYSHTAGIYLKASSGWESWRGQSGNGEDKFGFAALPGGYGTSGRYFYKASWEGYWWSASERDNESYYRVMYYDDGSANWWYYNKSNLLSVRCIQDSSSSGLESSSSSSVATCGGEEYSNATKYCSNGELRDYGLVQDDGGNIYKTVVIGDQTWMAENLNYNVSDSRCYGDASGGDSLGNCAKYGRLYDWATAMSFNAGCNRDLVRFCNETIVLKHKGICPYGWHIPSSEEWTQLYHYADGTVNVDASSLYDSPTAGMYLKASSGWNGNGNGEDKFGFAALPGGQGSSHPTSDCGDFLDVGNNGYWWSTDEYGFGGSAYGRSMGYYYNGAYWNYHNKDCLRSIRCLED